MGLASEPNLNGLKWKLKGMNRLFKWLDENTPIAVRGSSLEKTSVNVSFKLLIALLQ